MPSSQYIFGCSYQKKTSPTSFPGTAGCKVEREKVEDSIFLLCLPITVSITQFVSFRFNRFHNPVDSEGALWVSQDTTVQNTKASLKLLEMPALTGDVAIT